MAKVDDFLYVREKADSDSEIVGKMYKGDRAVVKEAGDTWTKIESGNVTGYVKNEYCVTGTDALNYAKKHCDTVAKVSIDGLRIRKAPDTDAEVVKTVASGEHMDVNTKAEETDGWIAVKVGSDTCYVSDDYVTVTLDTGKAVTIEEEQAAIKAAEEKRQRKKRRRMFLFLLKRNHRPVSRHLPRQHRMRRLPQVQMKRHFWQHLYSVRPGEPACSV